MKGELTVITRVFSYEKGAGTGVSSDKMVASFSLHQQPFDKLLLFFFFILALSAMVFLHSFIFPLFP